MVIDSSLDLRHAFNYKEEQFVKAILVAPKGTEMGECAQSPDKIRWVLVGNLPPRP